MKKKWVFSSRKKSQPAAASPLQRTTSLEERLSEKDINLITPGTLLAGKVVFDQTTRMAGHIQGEVESRPGTALIITQEGLVEGNINADEVLIQGFVEGEIQASTRIVIAAGGRVQGSLRSPSVQMDFGAWFEGECHSGRPSSEAPPTGA
jgi:cytoskeletal protein CcmA (bactofilin family)